MKADHFGIAERLPGVFVTAIIVVKTFLNTRPATASRVAGGGSSSALSA